MINDLNSNKLINELIYQFKLIQDLDMDISNMNNKFSKLIKMLKKPRNVGNEKLNKSNKDTIHSITNRPAEERVRGNEDKVKKISHSFMQQ
jgi:hypothetical protein